MDVNDSVNKGNNKTAETEELNIYESNSVEEKIFSTPQAIRAGHIIIWPDMLSVNEMRCCMAANRAYTSEQRR